MALRQNRISTVVAIFVAIAGSVFIEASTGRLDPCSTPGLLSKGSGFYLGLAFWPGGTLDDWGPAIDLSTVTPGLSPCLLTTYNNTDSSNNSTPASHQQYLIDRGVVFATYEVKVDRMTVLRGNRTEQALLFGRTPNVSSNVTSVVAFRGAYRSPARYFYSNNASLTGGRGAVQELALIAQTDSGRLQSLQWNDVTCGGCGGRNTSQCLSARSTDGVQYSCAVSSNCTTAANSTTLSDPCLPAIYLGFSGSDKHERTFQSGYQIRKINQFSLVGFYQRASSRVKGVYDTISLGGLGNTGVNDGGIGQDTTIQGGSAA